VSARCLLVRVILPGMDRVDWQGGRLGRHAATCLRCQAETARYRKLQRGLGALREATEPAPDTLAPRVEHGIGVVYEEPPRVHARVAAAAATAGAVVAAAAGAAAVVAWRRAHGAT
jgi:hypothetical protein